MGMFDSLLSAAGWGTPPPKPKVPTPWKRPAPPADLNLGPEVAAPGAYQEMSESAKDLERSYDSLIKENEIAQDEWNKKTGQSAVPAPPTPPAAPPAGGPSIRSAPMGAFDYLKEFAADPYMSARRAAPYVNKSLGAAGGVVGAGAGSLFAAPAAIGEELAGTPYPGHEGEEAGLDNRTRAHLKMVLRGEGGGVVSQDPIRASINPPDTGKSAEDIALEESIRGRKLRPDEYARPRSATFTAEVTRQLAGEGFKLGTDPTFVAAMAPGAVGGAARGLFKYAAPFFAAQGAKGALDAFQDPNATAEQKTVAGIVGGAMALPVAMHGVGAIDRMGAIPRSEAALESARFRENQTMADNFADRMPTPSAPKPAGWQPKAWSPELAESMPPAAAAHEAALTPDQKATISQEAVARGQGPPPTPAKVLSPADTAAPSLSIKGPAKPADPAQLTLLNELLDKAVTEQDWPAVEKITTQLGEQAAAPEGTALENLLNPKPAVETAPPTPPVTPEPPRIPPEDLPIVPARTVGPGVVQPGLRPVEEPAPLPRRKYQPPEANLGQMLGGDKGAVPPPPSPLAAPPVEPSTPVPPPAAAPTSAPMWPERTPAEEATRQAEIQTDMMRQLKEWKTRQEGDRRSSVPPATPYPPELDRRLGMVRRATTQEGRDAALGRQEPPTIAPEPARPPGSVITPPPVRPGIAPDPNPTPIENPRTGVTAPDPNAVVITDPSVIGLDPKTYQFKESEPGTGNTGALAGATKWLPNSPPVTLHERLDGSLWIADGHQRFNKYQELKAAGHQLPPLRATILREADGYDVPTARRAASIQNVTEGSASALDIAKLLRDGDLSPDERAMIPKGSMSGAKLRAGEGLRSLAPEAWQAVVNGAADPEAVATVGKYFTDPQEQIAAIAAIGKRDIKGYLDGDAFVRSLRDETLVQREKGAQGDLFGNAGVLDVASDRADIIRATEGLLRSRRAAFSNALRNAPALEEAGNILVTDTNATSRSEAQKLLAYFAKYADQRGRATNIALRELAGEVNAKRLDTTTAANRLLNAIRRDIESDSGGGDGQTAGAPVQPAVGAGSAGELPVAPEGVPPVAEPAAVTPPAAPAPEAPPATPAEVQKILDEIKTATDKEAPPLAEVPFDLTKQKPAPTAPPSKMELEAAGQGDLLGAAPATTEASYAESRQAAAEATRIFKKAQDDYRARRIDDAEFLRAKATYDESTKKFDAAFADAEKAGVGSEPEAPKPETPTVEPTAEDVAQKPAIDPEDVPVIDKAAQRVMDTAIDKVSAAPPEKPALDQMLAGEEAPKTTYEQLPAHVKSFLTRQVKISEEEINGMTAEEAIKRGDDFGKEMKARKAQAAIEQARAEADQPIADTPLEDFLSAGPLEPKVSQWVKMREKVQRGEPIINLNEYGAFFRELGTKARRAVAITKAVEARPREEVGVSPRQGPGQIVDEELVDQLTELGQRLDFTQHTDPGAKANWPEGYTRGGEGKDAGDVQFPGAGFKPGRREMERQARYRAALLDKGTPSSLDEYAQSLAEMQDRTTAGKVRSKIEKADEAEPARSTDPNAKGEYLGTMFGELQKVKELYDKDPAFFWQIMRQAGMPAIGAMVGAKTDEEDPWQGAVLGAIAGASASGMMTQAGRQQAMRYARALKLWGSEKGNTALRLEPNDAKDLSLLHVLAPTNPEVAVPKAYRAMSKIMDELNTQMAYGSLAGQTRSIQKAASGVFLKRAVAEGRRMVAEYEKAGQPKKAKYVNNMADALGRRPTPWQVGTKSFGESLGAHPNYDWVERNVGTNMYRVLIGWAMDSVGQNATQPVLALRHVSTGDMAFGYRMAGTEWGKGQTKHVHLIRPTDLEETAPGVRETVPVGEKATAKQWALDPMRAMAKGDDFNRRVVYLAAMRAAERKGLMGPFAREWARAVNEQSFVLAARTEADAWARSVMRDTQGDIGPLSMNPMYRGPVGGSLRPFMKFPTLLTRNLIDMVFQPDATGRNRFVAATIAAVYLGKQIGLNLEDTLFMSGKPFGIDPGNPKEALKKLLSGDIFPGVKAVKHGYLHATGQAKDVIWPTSMEDIPNSDLGYLLGGRYPMKLLGTVNRTLESDVKPMLRGEKRTDHIVRTASGAVVKMSLLEDLLGLTGYKGTRVSAAAEAQSQATSAKYQGDADRKGQSQELVRQMRVASDAGHDDEVKRLTQELVTLTKSPTSAINARKGLNRTGWDRLMAQSSPRVRAMLQEKYAAQIKAAELSK